MTHSRVLTEGLDAPLSGGVGFACSILERLSPPFHHGPHRRAEQSGVTRRMACETLDVVCVAQDVETARGCRYIVETRAANLRIAQSAQLSQCDSRHFIQIHTFHTNIRPIGNYGRAVGLLFYTGSTHEPFPGIGD